MYPLLLISALITYILFKGIKEYIRLKKDKKFKAVIMDIHLYDGDKEISRKIASRPLKTSGMNINFVRRNDWLRMIIDYEYRNKGTIYKDQGSMSVLPESTLLRLKPGNKMLI